MGSRRPRTIVEVEWHLLRRNDPEWDADLKEVYDTERHLLYVACTRARHHLLVTPVEPASEFLDDMQV